MNILGILFTILQITTGVFAFLIIGIALWVIIEGLIKDFTK